MELSEAPIKRFITVTYEEKAQMTTEEYYNMNVEPWRLWYAQVKAGTRTFRFKDDPQEYNLDGPVQVAAVAPSPRKDSSDAPVPTESGRTFPWPLIGSLSALAAAAGWYFFRRKSVAG